MYDKKEFNKIKEAVLGKKYDLSFSFIEAEEIKRLNLTYRNKNKATDILSFPLSDTEGEIFICMEEAEKEAPKFERPIENFIKFLFIHGLVHLKGYDHSSTMESIEEGFRKKFGV